VTSLAAAERDRLCDTALRAGPDAPTLCGEWTVRDLLAHLVVREGNPVAGLGIFLPPLEGLAERAQARVAARDFDRLVERVRSGPPLLSPFSVPVVGSLANIAEYAVHHEDVRRAADGWEPRTLAPGEQDTLWRLVRTAGRGLGVQAPVGVVAERSDAAAPPVRLRRAPGSAGTVTVRGEPLEVLMLLYGRQAQSAVDLDGDPADVARLTGADLGI
jgi:uncharacterized protein (TIGR03085 family)